MSRLHHCQPQRMRSLRSVLRKARPALDALGRVLHLRFGDFDRCDWFLRNGRILLG